MTQSKKPYGDRFARLFLSLAIPGLSIVGLVILAWVVLAGDTSADTYADTTKYVFAAILPLMGTWVGTVLAYHFSKDNFESANQSVQSMVDKMTSQEKLQATSVSETMLEIDEAYHRELKPNEKVDSLKLIDGIVTPLEHNDYNRLPILDSSKKPVLVIHKSTANEFISSQARASVNLAGLKVLTLAQIFKQTPKLRSHSFVTVSKDDNLAEAKQKMEAISDYNCLDVLVTKDGKKNSVVVGWLTNLMITKAAQV